MLAAGGTERIEHRPRDQASLNGILIYVAHVGIVVGLVSNQVFGEPCPPDGKLPLEDLVDLVRRASLINCRAFSSVVVSPGVMTACRWSGMTV